MINLLLITIGLLCTSCNSKQELDFLQTSARNRKVDTKNFIKVKRLPLYNGKYIAKAKRNIFMQEYGYDAYNNQKDLIEMQEGQNITEQNKNAYRSMVEHDIQTKHIHLKKAYPNNDISTKHKEEMVLHTDQTESLKKKDKVVVAQKPQKKVAKKTKPLNAPTKQKIHKTLLIQKNMINRSNNTEKSKILLDDLYNNSKAQGENYDVIKPISYIKKNDFNK